MQFARHRAAYRGGVRGFRGHLGALGRAVDRLEVHLLKILVQPAAALVENLRLRIDPLNLGQPAVGQQIVMHRDEHLAANHRRRVLKTRQRIGDRSARRVFNRHETVVRVVAADLLENAGDILDRKIFDRRAELSHCGYVAERPRRTKVRDPKRTLQTERSAHQLAPDRDQRFVVQGAVVRRTDPVEDLPLALGCVDRQPGVGLELADVHDDLRALVKQLDQFRVQCVDSLAKVFQIHPPTPPSRAPCARRTSPDSALRTDMIRTLGYRVNAKPSRKTMKTGV